MTSRTPWYFRPRSMGRRQARLVALTAPLLATGIGFMAGWTLVHFPSRSGSGTADAPNWLLWAGSALLVTGVAVYAVARLTSAPYDPDVPSARMAPANDGCLRTFLIVPCLGGPMLLAAVVSTDSRYRWHPLVVLGGALVVFPLLFIAGLLDPRKP